jgi:hypothetical protein
LQTTTISLNVVEKQMTDMADDRDAQKKEMG